MGHGVGLLTQPVGYSLAAAQALNDGGVIHGPNRRTVSPVRQGLSVLR